MKDTSKAAVVLLTLELAYAACIYESAQTPLQGIPNGHLYAQSMEKGFPLELHLTLIKALKTRSLIRENNFLLTWAGPPDWNFDTEFAKLRQQFPECFVA